MASPLIARVVVDGK